VWRTPEELADSAARFCAKFKGVPLATTVGLTESREQMLCVNLKDAFGDRFKVLFEESYRAERPEYRREKAPWLMILPCQHGHIGPWDGTLLAACTDKAGGIAKRLKSLSFTTVAQDGTDGANIVFDVEYFDQVASIMKPRKRRRLSEAQKAVLAKHAMRKGYDSRRADLGSTKNRAIKQEIRP
jgi:hypothetical protein